MWDVGFKPQYEVQLLRSQRPLIEDPLGLQPPTRFRGTGRPSHHCIVWPSRPQYPSPASCPTIPERRFCPSPRRKDSGNRVSGKPGAAQVLTENCCRESSSSAWRRWRNTALPWTRSYCMRTGISGRLVVRYVGNLPRADVPTGTEGPTRFFSADPPWLCSEAQRTVSCRCHSWEPAP